MDFDFGGCWLSGIFFPPNDLRHPTEINLTLLIAIAQILLTSTDLS
ncbi:hypothetical protein [Merismopedia glauca]